MRCIRDRLDERLESFVAGLIEQDRQYNRNREACDQLVGANRDRIANQRPELKRVEEPRKMRESHPRTAQNPLHGVEIFESNRHAVHRDIVKNK